MQSSSLKLLGDLQTEEFLHSSWEIVKAEQYISLSSCWIKHVSLVVELL